MKNKKIDILRIITVLFVVVWIIYLYINILTPSRLPPVLRVGTLNKLDNILILGTDYYINAETRESKPGRTDTIILLRFDSSEQKIHLLSLPRDSYVKIPGFGMRKINQAYVLGGANLTIKTIEDILDCKIDHYLSINPNLVTESVDLLGGIGIEVDKRMVYEDKAQNLHINIKKGYQVLNGEQSSQFLRYRMDAMGDIARIERQQRFLKAFFAKLMHPAQMIKAPLLVKIFKQNLETNLSAKEIVMLLNSARMMNPEDIETIILPGETRDREPGNWFVNKEEIKRLKGRYF